jgi:hypothetical protein
MCRESACARGTGVERRPRLPADEDVFPDFKDHAAQAAVVSVQISRADMIADGLTSRWTDAVIELA